MESTGYTKFINCRILRDHQLLNDQLWVADGKILDPHESFFVNKLLPKRIIDCKGAIVSPGFIDLQINGGFGYDFSDSLSGDSNYLEKALEVVSKGVLAHGVTSFCPTLITQSAESYKNLIPRIRKNLHSTDRANILGSHLEGPFISRVKKGAHPEKYVINEPISSFNQMAQVYGYDLHNVAIITLAPELLENKSIIAQLTAMGVTVSIGHSETSFDDAVEAVNNGARFITHLFNAMAPFRHREPGPIGLIASAETYGKIHYGIIADGEHTDRSAINLVYKTNPSKMVLVTDALSALGLTTGSRLRIGAQTIEVKHNGAYVAGTETLAGSITPMVQCISNLRNFTNCSIVDALECATLHPARVLGIEKVKGTLNYGCDADFVLLDDQLCLQSTYLLGRKVWSRNVVNECN